LRPATHPGMTSPPEIARETPLDRLVAALVDWGATASQIVSHMELSRSVHATKSSRETVTVFRELLTETLAPTLADRPDELERAADLVARVDARIRDEIYLVALPRLPARRRTAHRRARG
jgi:hypothetical protein